MISQIRPARRAGGSTPRARSPSEHPDVRPWPRSRSRGTAVARLRSPADSEATAPRAEVAIRSRVGSDPDRHDPNEVLTAHARSAVGVLVARSGAGCSSSRQQNRGRCSGGEIWCWLQIFAPPNGVREPLVWWRDLAPVADPRATRIGVACLVARSGTGCRSSRQQNRGGESGRRIGVAGRVAGRG